MELARRAAQAVQAGQWDSAEKLSRRALEREPDNLQALGVLGICAMQRSAPAEAVPVLERLARLQPGPALNWVNLGTALRAAGQLETALDAYREAGRRGANSADFLYNLGLLHLDRRDYPAALACLRQAAALAPGDADIRYYYAQCCYDCVRNDEAIAALQGWRGFAGPSPERLVQLGTLLMQLGESIESEAALRQALQQDPAFLLAALRLVLLLERTNRVDEAQQQLASIDLERAAARHGREDVLTVQAHMAQRLGDHALARSSFAELAQLAADAQERHHALFQLAKACDALRDYTAAFTALDEAHASQMAFIARSAPRFAVAEADPLAITRYPAAPADVERWRQVPGPPASECPVFIVGFPRSGTTLLEQMLDAHPALCAMDEQPFLQDAIGHVKTLGVEYPEQLAQLSEAQCAELRALYWARVRTRVQLGAGQRLVDKNPLNLLRLPAIRRLFPAAHVILAIRHPCDVMISCYMQHFRAPAFARLCQSLPSLAAGYRRAFDFWYAQAALLSPQVLELRYEDLVADFEPNARAIAAFLELPWDDAMLQPGASARRKGFISTPSYAQVLQPVNRRAVERWRNYQDHFDPAVLAPVSPYLERWGYSP